MAELDGSLSILALVILLNGYIWLIVAVRLHVLFTRCMSSWLSLRLTSSIRTVCFFNFEILYSTYCLSIICSWYAQLFTRTLRFEQRADALEAHWLDSRTAQHSSEWQAERRSRTRRDPRGSRWYQWLESALIGAMRLHQKAPGYQLRGRSPWRVVLRSSYSSRVGSFVDSFQQIHKPVW